jgi:hypothetical protein
MFLPNGLCSLFDGSHRLNNKKEKLSKVNPAPEPAKIKR